MVAKDTVVNPAVIEALANLVAISKQAGRQEVVDWVRENSEVQNPYWHSNLFTKTAITTENWEAKLKEWEL